MGRFTRKQSERVFTFWKCNDKPGTIHTMPASELCERYRKWLGERTDLELREFGYYKLGLERHFLHFKEGKGYNHSTIREDWDEIHSLLIPIRKEFLRNRNIH